jgi:multiple sugar transport system ATP-binding protein
MSRGQGLRLESIHHNYGTVRAITDLSLDVPTGTFLTLLGPSGCGKSTTLSLIAGLERPTSGSVWFDDEDITHLPPNERQMAMVFQNYALYPHQSVYQNIAFGLKLQKRSKEEIAKRVGDAASILDIGHLLERKPTELSGGQQQRVAIGRALVKEPSVFLLDEPFSNLDATLRAKMRTEVKQLHLQLGTTSILVTHDQEEAMTMSDLIAVMRDGKVVQYGTQRDIYAKPLNTYVATFVGKPRMSMMEGVLESSGDDVVFRNRSGVINLGPANELGVTIPPAGGVIIGIRAEGLHISQQSTPAARSVSVKVELVEPIGSDTFVNVAFGSDRLTARTTPDHELSIGQKVNLEIRGPVHLFDATTSQRIN